MSFCFCKQKTAYEMRISDWSSDVCSSDLLVQTFLRDMAEIEPSDLLATQPLHRARCLRGTQVATVAKQGGDEAFSWVIDLGFKAGQWSEQSMQVEPQIGRASCRERVCQYV